MILNNKLTLQQYALIIGGVHQGYNSRKVNCSCVYSAYSVHIETSSLLAEFVNKNRCISIRLVSEEDKSI